MGLVSSNPAFLSRLSTGWDAHPPFATQNDPGAAVSLRETERG